MIITISGAKGGVAKTTTAIHLAEYLSRGEGEVLLMDNDPSRFAIEYSRNSEGRGLGFDVLSQSAAMNKIHRYSHLVIDTEARPSRDDVAELAEGCDLMVVPCPPAAMPLAGLALFADMVGSVKNWSALLTMVPPLPNRQGEETRAALEDAGFPVFRGEIPRSVLFDHASREGVPVSEMGPRGKALWSAYAAIGEEIDEWQQQR